MKTAVDIADLSFTYRRYGGQAQPDPVLRTVNLSLREGSKTLVLGIPDSGKSTLSKILCALVPRHFDGDLTGTVRIDGTDISECTPWELMTRVTLVAQNPQEQLLMTTCADEVAFPLESLGVEHTALVDTVHNALQRWGLYSMAQVNPQEISGGERKRLLLAVTEAVNAPIWIMDEPFDDLDEQWRQLLLSRILEKKGTVVVFASRYLDEFRGNFDTYCHLWEGTLSCKSEVEIVVEYDRECDLQFAPMQEELDELPNHTLHCTNLSIVHPRRSVSSDQPFSLSGGTCRAEWCWQEYPQPCIVRPRSIGRGQHRHRWNYDGRQRLADPSGLPVPESRLRYLPSDRQGRVGMVLAPDPTPGCTGAGTDGQRVCTIVPFGS